MKLWRDSDTWADRLRAATICRLFGHRPGRKMRAVVCRRCWRVIG